MKRRRLLSLSLGTVLAANMCCGIPVLAANQVYPATPVPYTFEVEEDSLTKQATKINEVQTTKNGRITTTTTYKLADGTTFVDSFERADLSKIRSSSGTDTATRTRYIKGVTLKMTANFKWYVVDHLYSVVECTNASGTYTLNNSNIVKSKCDVSRPTSASKFSVKATMSYRFYEKSVPHLFDEGDFYIKCTSSGTISDNA